MKIYRRFILPLLVSTPLYATPFEITGTINHTIQNADKTATKEITLLKVKLSEQAMKHLKARAGQLSESSLKIPSSKLPERVQLGMNGVPVMDQGHHGSCVTFANTAAIDAALGQGDYISQLCQLQLGRYLENNGFLYSGWKGSYGPYVLHQMTQFGIVSKENQKKYGCGGLTDYPLDKPDPQSEMPLEEYRLVSEKLPFHEEIWYPLLPWYQSTVERTDTTKILERVKKALKEGDRVTFGVLLLDFDLGVAGAVGKHHVANDTWVLTPEIARDVVFNPDFGGHEMIITGYDDSAVARDPEGRQHHGLLTIRNSWGSDYGFHGDFYMSYDYFVLLVDEAQRIRSIKSME
ncbi:C1 family peptidase [Legionella impletisoli]|uniref:Peptidase C1 n=1 Tax=Legionella impletisoli TaxID=343510 RepID=A0A917JQX0_9GAMM|nr:C1 family peptidase [Legionella impletisoli]GGI81929.1 peptidase C1 [Legionella impletisoli]